MTALTGALKQKGYSVKKEHLFATASGRFKPDILAARDGHPHPRAGCTDRGGWAAPAGAPPGEEDEVPGEPGPHQASGRADAGGDGGGIHADDLLAWRPVPCISGVPEDNGNYEPHPSRHGDKSPAREPYDLDALQPDHGDEMKTHSWACVTNVRETFAPETVTVQYSANKNVGSL